MNSWYIGVLRLILKDDPVLVASVLPAGTVNVHLQGPAKVKKGSHFFSRTGRLLDMLVGKGSSLSFKFISPLSDKDPENVGLLSAAILTVTA
jgi:hypothetical protein